mmetsp:Transcript_14964/g.43223  ORF Transcript_14964/g.43223 Transcript_14964/m.43223 type:complete len:207 (+) Transcript_14964:618-1238(+)
MDGMLAVGDDTGVTSAAKSRARLISTATWRRAEGGNRFNDDDRRRMVGGRPGRREGGGRSPGISILLNCISSSENSCSVCPPANLTERAEPTLMDRRFTPPSPMPAPMLAGRAILPGLTGTGALAVLVLRAPPSSSSTSPAKSSSSPSSFLASSGRKTASSSFRRNTLPSSSAPRVAGPTTAPTSSNRTSPRLPTLRKLSLPAALR